MQNCALCTKYVKKYYDNIFGKDNWEYISIGRSCAKIADCLEVLGVKSYTIPISGLKYMSKNGSELAKIDGFDDYRNFIYSLGLNPERVENSKKTFIFQDYSDSGNSIERFREFITSDKMGLDKDNIVFDSINNVINSCFNPATPMDDMLKLLKFQNGLASQNTIFSIKTYCKIKKLPYTNLADIKTGVIDNLYFPREDFEYALMHFLQTD